MSPSWGRPLQFSTDSVPEAGRISYLREFFGRVIVKLDLELLDRQNFHHSCTLQALPGLGIALGTTSGTVCRRTRALLADSNDSFIFTVNLAGRSFLSQRDKEIQLGTNEALLVSSADIGSQAFRESARYLSLSIPREALRGRVGAVEDALMRPISKDSAALRLLVNYVLLASREHLSFDAQVQHAVATHVHDLVALALGATRDGAAIAQGRGVRAARLSAIKADILARLREEGLSIQDVAFRQGVTPRYVQFLFDSDGQTFSEFVLEQRLMCAHRMLTDPRYSSITIGAISCDAGFGNLSYFNRTFLARFGATPSDVRAAARRNRD